MKGAFELISSVPAKDQRLSLGGEIVDGWSSPRVRPLSLDNVNFVGH